jgi:hypothetical protein
MDVCHLAFCAGVNNQPAAGVHQGCDHGVGAPPFQLARACSAGSSCSAGTVTGICTTPNPLTTPTACDPSASILCGYHDFGTGKDWTCPCSGTTCTTDFSTCTHN